MPKFKIIFHRKVVEMDELERVIEAPSERLATEQAALMTNEFDRSCPDDAATVGGADCEGWFVEFVLQAPDDAEVSDPDEATCRTCYEAIETRVAPCDECGHIDEEDSEDRPVKCDNCDWQGTEDELNEAKDLSQRLDPGCEVPAGECPECGCLAYLKETDAELLDKAEQKHNAQMADDEPIDDTGINEALAPRDEGDIL